MKNLLNDIKELTSDLKEKQTVLNNVVSNIKIEMADHYFQYLKDDGTFFRFALQLLHGEYNNNYESEVVKNIKLIKVSNWKTHEYSGYYQILQATSWNYGYPVSYSPVGFVCKKKNLFTSLSKEHLYELWKKQVVKEDYKLGLKEFITELSLPVNLEKLIKLLNKYDILDITEVNYPSLKIKNIIICKY